MSFREQYPNLEEDVVALGQTDTELAELRVEVERLRTLVAALVALLERTQPFLASYLCNGWQEGDKLSALEREVKKALTAEERRR